MLGNGEEEKEAIRPDFNKSIFIDFAGAKLTSDAGFLLMREVDQRFGIIESGCSHLMDKRSVSHKKHTYGQMIRHGFTRLGQATKTATTLIFFGLIRHCGLPWTRGTTSERVSR